MIFELYEQGKLIGSTTAEDMKKDAPTWDGSTSVGDFVFLDEREMQIIEKNIRFDENITELHLQPKK